MENNENNKVVSTAEKVKAFASAFIGVCFFSIGNTYFQERLVYRLPRIFIPVLELFGNVALAIAMLILGLTFIYYGFTRWKKVSTKTTIYWVISIAALVIGASLAIWTDSDGKKDPIEIRNEIEQDQQDMIDKVKASGDLNFRNANVEKHIADFNAIYKKYQHAVETKNEEETKNCWDEYMAWSERTANLMGELNTDQKTELARYLAKLGIMWSDVK